MNKIHCIDVCSDKITGTPKVLGIMAPVIYDEVGINLCATSGTVSSSITTRISKVTAQVAQIEPDYGTLVLEPMKGRNNCYEVTLSNVKVTFNIKCFDNACNYLGETQTQITYINGTGDEETNPSSVTFEIYAPYGVSFDYTRDATGIDGVRSNINIIDYMNTLDTATVPSGTQSMDFPIYNTTNTVTQGINLFAMSKLLNYDIDSSNNITITMGITLVLQSLYFEGYKFENLGKIKIPKGSILPPDETECLKFVRGDLLNLEIKPLDIGFPAHEEWLKESCGCNSCCDCCDSIIDINKGETPQTDEETQ